MSKSDSLRQSYVQKKRLKNIKIKKKTVQKSINENRVDVIQKIFVYGELIFFKIRSLSAIWGLNTESCI